MKIDDLRSEIKAFSDEIEKLQAELAAAGGRTLQLATSVEPSAIATAVREQAQLLVQQQPILRGIQDAIAELTDRLALKKAQLEELEVEQLKQLRKKRIEEGKSRLRAKFTDVEKMAESLQNLFFELKAIALEYETDFAQIHPPTSGGTALNRNSLLNYEVLALPTITEENQRFILNSRFINLFEEEKRLLKQQQLENSRVYRLERQRELAEIKQREIDEQLRIEEKERQLLLPIKTSQLKAIKDERERVLAGLATANVSDFDDAIASLEAEIESLHKPVQT